MTHWNQYRFVEGGICVTNGFEAAGIHCGILDNSAKMDLALVRAPKPCRIAACYTRNKLKGSAVVFNKRNLTENLAQAIVVNSGNANTGNIDGEQKARQMCELTAQALNLPSSQVIISSTGVIGVPLPIEPIAAHLEELAQKLSRDGHTDAATAIQTTDTVIKEVAVEFQIDGKTCHIGGMAKGSGMIHPNMATMLCFLSTDVDIEQPFLQQALSYVTDRTFNMVSIDGDTSTNDMVAILSSGSAGNPTINDQNGAYQIFVNALYAVLREVARKLAADGEGSTKLIECTVTHAASEKLAQSVAKSIITSNLFKAAVFGEDANWGRILCAIGYAEGDFDINKISVKLAAKTKDVLVCKNGRGVDFSEDQLNFILRGDEVRVLVNMHDGDAEATAWGCDLTYDYVKINGEYRT